MQLKQLIDSVDLVKLFERTVGQPATQGRWLLFHCPCHADQYPSLAIVPERNRWRCFGRCNTGGDALDWLQLRQGISFDEARMELARLSSAWLTTHSRPQVQPRMDSLSEPPPRQWQEAARRMIDLAEEKLWSAMGERTRDWLHRRGLDDATLRDWRIGFNPNPRRIGGLFVQRGIVIPCIERGAIWSLKIRRAQGVPKYVHVAGGRPALFGTQNLAGKSVAVVTEGEFDALLVHQHASDLVGPVTLGSASTRLSATWLAVLLPIYTLLVVYDHDVAGAKGASWWASLSKRVHIAHVPMGKDLTDFAVAGGDLRAFIQFELTRIGRDTERPMPNSLPTPALGFSKFNSELVSGAIPLEAGTTEGRCHD